jgi:thiamine kinase-like enzyme
MSFMPGVHGQELIDEGLSRCVLRACGHMLRRIHAIAPALAHIPAASQHSVVFVHGDYGPNNLLLDRDARAVTAVVDWEWAHAGDPVEDLAYTQCRSMLSLCERWEPGGPGSRQWRHRLATTQSWTE